MSAGENGAAPAKPGVAGSLHHRAKREAVESTLAYLNGEVEQPAWPLEIFLEVSNICDLKCAMCTTFSPLNEKRYLSLKAERRGLLDLETIKPRIQALVEHALVVHAFGYGEPTIHPQFRELLAFLSEHEVWIDFFTNGMHLDESFCRFLVEQRIARITISFSGATQEEYENVYIDGSFPQILENLTRLKQIKEELNSPFPEVHVNSIAFKHHVERLPQFVKLMAEHGVEVIHLKPLATYDLIPQLHQHVSVCRDEIEGSILREAKQVADECGINLASAPYERFRASAEQEADEVLRERHKGENRLAAMEVSVSDLKAAATAVMERLQTPATKMGPVDNTGRRLDLEGETVSLEGHQQPCLEPFRTLYLALDGSMRPCCFAREIAPLGNIHDHTGGDAWSNAYFSATRKALLEGRYYRSLCGGCLKSSSYPKDLALEMKISQYSRLFKARFGVPFHTHLLRMSRVLGDNREILAAMGNPEGEKPVPPEDGPQKPA